MGTKINEMNYQDNNDNQIDNLAYQENTESFEEKMAKIYANSSVKVNNILYWNMDNNQLARHNEVLWEQVVTMSDYIKEQKTEINLARFMWAEDFKRKNLENQLSMLWLHDKWNKEKTNKSIDSENNWIFWAPNLETKILWERNIAA